MVLVLLLLSADEDDIVGDTCVGEWIGVVTLDVGAEDDEEGAGRNEI